MNLITKHLKTQASFQAWTSKSFVDIPGIIFQAQSKRFIYSLGSMRKLFQSNLKDFQICAIEEPRDNAEIQN